MVTELLEYAQKYHGPDSASVKDLERQLAALKFQQETGYQTSKEMFLAYSRPFPIQPSTDSLEQTTERLHQEMEESVPHQFEAGAGEDES